MTVPHSWQVRRSSSTGAPQAGHVVCVASMPLVSARRPVPPGGERASAPERRPEGGYDTTEQQRARPDRDEEQRGTDGADRRGNTLEVDDGAGQVRVSRAGRPPCDPRGGAGGAATGRRPPRPRGAPSRSGAHDVPRGEPRLAPQPP